MVARIYKPEKVESEKPLLVYSQGAHDLNLYGNEVVKLLWQCSAAGQSIPSTGRKLREWFAAVNARLRALGKVPALLSKDIMEAEDLLTDELPKHIARLRRLRKEVVKNLPMWNAEATRRHKSADRWRLRQKLRKTIKRLEAEVEALQEEQEEEI